MVRIVKTKTFYSLKFYLILLKTPFYLNIVRSNIIIIYFPKYYPVIICLPSTRIYNRKLYRFVQRTSLLKRREREFNNNASYVSRLFSMEERESVRSSPTHALPFFFLMNHAQLNYNTQY